MDLCKRETLRARRKAEALGMDHGRQSRQTEEVDDRMVGLDRENETGQGVGMTTEWWIWVTFCHLPREENTGDVCLYICRANAAILGFLHLYTSKT